MVRKCPFLIEGTVVIQFEDFSTPKIQAIELSYCNFNYTKGIYSQVGAKLTNEDAE